MNNANFNEILRVKRTYEDRFFALPGVHAVSLRYKQRNGRPTDDLAICFHTSKKRPNHALPHGERIPSSMEGFLTDVSERVQLECCNSDDDEHESGEHTEKHRPLLGGCGITVSSIASEPVRNGTATLGCIVIYKEKPALLSNRHVLVNRDGYTVVFQPTPFSKNLVGKTICASEFSCKHVDGAIAELNSEVEYQNWILGMGAVKGSYKITHEDIQGFGYPVRKYGAHTGLTNGFVKDIKASGTRHDGWKYEDQILIEPGDGTRRPFARVGDSGSVLMNYQNEVVGLIWGGANPNFKDGHAADPPKGERFLSVISDELAVGASPIEKVFSELHVSLPAVD